jgi:WD40 repeat protein
MAQVDISFPAWKGAHVAPSTHTVRIVAPKGSPKQEPVSSRLLRTLVHPDRKANVVDVRFFADGTRLFAAGYPSGVVQVFDPATGKELRRIESPPGYRGSANYAIATPDFRTLYVPVERRKVVSLEKDGQKQRRITYNGELLAWDLGSGKEMPSLATSSRERGVLAAYMSPTGDKLVTVERPGYRLGEKITDETLLWDLKTRTANSLGEGYGMAAFSGDGRLLAVALFSSQKEPSRLSVKDLKSGRTLFTAEARAKNRGFSSPAFSPDGKMLAVQDGAGLINQPGTIRLYAVESGRELATFESTGKYPFNEPAFSPDGRRLAAGDYHGGVTVWDVAARKVERKIDQSGIRPLVAFSLDGARLAVLTQPKWNRADYGDDPDPVDLPQPRVLLFNLLRGGEPEVIICPHGYAGELAFSPDGKTLAVGEAGGVHLFDLSKK